jgi:hypothetical protein
MESAGGPGFAFVKDMNNSNHSERNTAENKPRPFRRSRTAENTVRTLDEVGEILGLSRQRVHDIETRAFKKLRHAFVRQMPSLELERDEQGSVCGLRDVERGSPA